MKEYEDRTYGERIAAVYDEWYADYEEAMVDLLYELAGGGRALELGIGTGRVALPLCARGIDVTGLDASEAMIARLRARPGGDSIPVVRGSFAQFEIEARFDLVYVVFNTFYGLLTQEEQVSCFQSVARHLTDDGVFVLELFVPDVCRFEGGQTVRAVKVDTGEVRLDVTLHDPAAQLVTSQHVELSQAGIRLFPVRLRYAWPSELDLMARVAGLSLKHRWASWEKGTFTAESGKHISVYARAGGLGF
ncbi:MAG: class I SAM-dependent methyltransferase [Anaerolineae bacterium]|nr:class I SAM-dependent methyltransferase [Anaerolineae bacterium]